VTNLLSSDEQVLINVAIRDMLQHSHYRRLVDVLRGDGEIDDESVDQIAGSLQHWMREASRATRHYFFTTEVREAAQEIAPVLRAVLQSRDA